VATPVPLVSQADAVFAAWQFFEKGWVPCFPGRKTCPSRQSGGHVQSGGRLGGGHYYDMRATRDIALSKRSLPHKYWIHLHCSAVCVGGHDGDFQFLAGMLEEGSWACSRAPSCFPSCFPVRLGHKD